MAYTINKTDGTIVATIADGTIDTSTSLTLFGQNYSGFGELLNENLVKLLENSSSTSSPTAPIKGELWFDNNTGQLKVYNGSQFEPTGGAQASASQPSNPSIGDLWLDSTNDQVFVYTGDSRSHQINDEWELLGPAFTASQTQSGFVIETIGSAGGDKVVASMYAGTTRVAILSKETFTPSVSQTGFATIKAGITLNSTLSAVFEGTTTAASSLNVSQTSNTSASVIAGGNFLRSDVADTTVGALTVDTDSGVIIGDAQELEITVSSNNVTLAQTSEDKDFTISTNTGGTQTNRLAITGASGAMAITGNVTITGNLNISGEYNATSSAVSTYDDAFIKVNNGNSEVDAGLIVETSDTDDARLFYEVGTNRWMAGENQNYSQVITDAIATTNGATSQGSVLKTDSSGTVTLAGVTLSSVGSISEGDTSNAAVPTIGAVVTFGNLWGGSAKTVSTSQPTSGDGDNGDFWFVREA
jgi:hypothetical protein|tara:strand:- start:340 stop:1755 length:1416 start_codon:yes stop_codon:yes gene_type:complete